MRKKATEAPVGGADKLAKVRAQAEIIGKVKARCKSLARKQEWSVTDLAAFVRSIGEIVGAPFTEE